MPLKKSEGQMYPWVTHTHSHLIGKCQHGCSYCYVQDMARRYARRGLPAMLDKYSGPVRLNRDELKLRYGKGKVVFIEHMNDLFAQGVPSEFIEDILAHCREYPESQYVFQTKNPERYQNWLEKLPENSILGTTIESNRLHPQMGAAPMPELRYYAMLTLPQCFKNFVTIEPVMDFDVDILAGWIADIRPDFINLGADSKGQNLVEPTPGKIMQFTAKLKEYGIELREKHNLERFKK